MDHNNRTTEGGLARVRLSLLCYKAWVSNFVEAICSLYIVLQNNSPNIMSETNIALPENSDAQMTFASEHSWMVQCLSLAALGLLTYLHIAPVIASTV